MTETPDVARRLISNSWHNRVQLELGQRSGILREAAGCLIIPTWRCLRRWNGEGDNWLVPGGRGGGFGVQLYIYIFMYWLTVFIIYRHNVTCGLFNDEFGSNYKT